MTGFTESFHTGRGEGYTVFVVFDLLGYSYNHVRSSFTDKRKARKGAFLSKVIIYSFPILYAEEPFMD
jgi:hypothetical protein